MNVDSSDTMASKIIGLLLIFLSLEPVSSQNFNEFKWRDCRYHEYRICVDCECRCKDVNSKTYKVSNQQLVISCKNKSLNSIETDLISSIEELKHELTFLDLAQNQLQTIPARIFENLVKVKELDLSSNDLTSLDKDAFAGLYNLRAVILDGNKFKDFPAEAFLRDDLPELREILMDNCYLTDLGAHNFSRLGGLHKLWLKSNSIREIPYSSLTYLPNLTELWLSGNLIGEIRPFSFQRNSHLRILALQDNSITYIPDSAFAGLTVLTELHLDGNPLTNVGLKAFNNLPLLQSLKISHVRNLRALPDFSGTGNLKEISSSHCNISTIPDDFCTTMENLTTLRLYGNKLEKIPPLAACEKLVTLNLGFNHIREIGNFSFDGPDLLDLVLRKNMIEHIPEHAFVGLRYLEHLDLSENKIKSIHDLAFEPLMELHTLNLGGNQFKYLPSTGLSNLVDLYTPHNPELHSLPPPEELPAIETIKTSYAYHCCQYLDLGQRSFSEIVEQHWLVGPSLGNDESSDPSNYSNYDYGNASISFSDFAAALAFSGYSWSYFQDFQDKPERNITCNPEPGPFVPCGDIFDSWYLRLGVWTVFLLALFGNAMVLLVNVFSRTKMDVSRFLICNLACADLMMGVYLAILAIADITTLGEFQRFGVEWQLGIACKFIGFLGVLSSELSIYTLTVITMERFYTLKYALYSKRLKLRGAVAIMGVGWLFATVVATLPLLNVSSYVTVVCLPMDVSNDFSKYLLLFFLILNATSFIVIMCCYASIYYSIQGSSAWNSKDSLIAKRMSILVFTDFICWAPIVFFAVTASFDLQLISLSGAKFLTIFIFPINSCANPFLYTLLTKQFKADCRTLARKVCGQLCLRKHPRPSITIGNNANGNEHFRKVSSPSNDVAYLQRYDDTPVADAQRISQEEGAIPPEVKPNRPDSPEGCLTVSPGSMNYQQDLMACHELDNIRRGSGSPLLERHDGSSRPHRLGSSGWSSKSKRKKFAIPFLSWRGDHRTSRTYSNKDWDGSAVRNAKPPVRRSVSMSEGMLNAKHLMTADLRDAASRGGGDLSTTPEMSSSDGGSRSATGDAASISGGGSRPRSLQGSGPIAQQQPKSPEHRSNRSPIHLCIPRSPLSKKPKESILAEGIMTNSENTTEFSLTDFETDSTMPGDAGMVAGTSSDGLVQSKNDTDDVSEQTSSLLQENNNSRDTGAVRKGSPPSGRLEGGDRNLTSIMENWVEVEREDSSDCSDKLLSSAEPALYHQTRKESLV